METKFTKGKWFIVETIEGYMTITSDNIDVCTVFTDISDANLIACAPEMYQLLETLIGNYQVAASIADHEGYETRYDQDKVFVDLLLEKARGEKY